MKIIKIKSSQGGLEKKGSEKGPDKVLEKLKNLFTNEFGRDIIYQIKEIPVVENNIEETNKNIEEGVEENSIILGGDHSITYPAFKKFSEKYKNPGIIVFDAHPDCEHMFEPPSHEDYLRVLIEKGFVKKENVILIGVRNSHRLETEFLKENKIKVYDMKRLNDIDYACEVIMENANSWDATYLSIDIDVVDPSMAPGTGHCEPGGLNSRDLIKMVQRLKNLNNLKIVDIVEINPDKDVNDLTSTLGAKLVGELL